MSTLKKFAKDFLYNQMNKNGVKKDDQMRIVKESETSKKKIKTYEIKNNLSKFRNVLRKITILKSLNHDNIVKINESLISKDHLMMEMDYYDYNLKQVLREKNKGLTDDHVKYIFYQILLSVAYLHSQEIEHLNINPDCILLTNECDVKLSGFSKANPKYLPKATELKSIYQDYFMAPELILNNGNNTHCQFKADIWSLGCIFFELLERKHVLGYKRQYLDQLKWMFKLLGSPSRKQLNWIQNFEAKKWVSRLKSQKARTASSYLGPNNVDKNAHDLLDKMLKINPFERSSALKLLKHPYFSELYHENDVMFLKSAVNVLDFMPCHPHNENSRVMRMTAIKLSMK